MSDLVRLSDTSLLNLRNGTHGDDEPTHQSRAESAQPRINADCEVLNLGCGRKRLPDAINLDQIAELRPDVIHDLDQTPWPFHDQQFSEVLAYDVLEHCANFISTMDEIHRISRPGAIIRITVPHFSSFNAFSDPTHRRYFGYSSFDYITGDHEFSFYTPKQFRRRARQLIFYPGVVNKLLWRLANRYPVKYERRWAWIFPAWFLYFELEVAK